MEIQNLLKRKNEKFSLKNDPLSVEPQILPI